MKDVNDRFIEFYNYLSTQKIVLSAKDFALKIGVSSSLITEITKGRSVVGTKAIQNSVIEYNLNADWLFTGTGEMIKSNQVDIKPIDNIWLLKRFEELVSENALLKKEVTDLKTSRGSNIDKPSYPLSEEKIESHFVAEPGTPKRTH